RCSSIWARWSWARAWRPTPGRCMRSSTACSLAAKVRAVQARYRDDPIGFNRDVLRRAPYWSRQEEVARSVLDHRITVVYSGNAVGKDYLLGGLIPWYGFTRPGSLVMVTGVS